MNEAAQTYWNEFWERQGRDKPESVSAWPFGAAPDHLAQLVIDGIKTATCSSLISYEIENEPIPSAGDYSIILNSQDMPVAIIQTTEVNIMPMNEVSEDFASAEGEGDRSYRYWREVHEAYFKNELSRFGLEFSDDISLICERFRLVDVKK
ncbi:MULTISPECIES: ASCH domain-containing protein [Paenibacillus]|uniref:RNA-binding protein n=1 Tax=Paenibacillus azoreducens TaxID=116718 RepID=A0A919Y9L6_9BACL|nr:MULTISPECIES: ASCH domain-containing protein [Paenibacillus]MBE9918026.1 ASCH domain-containing protein [Paenibacillus donghaensis]GIO46681.1 RNA-binding protein [Paenibacillus azoreducens]